MNGMPRATLKATHLDPAVEAEARVEIDHYSTFIGPLRSDVARPFSPPMPQRRVEDSDVEPRVTVTELVRPAGSVWTAPEVREWLRDALDTLRRMRASPNSWPAEHCSTWPMIVRDYYESYGLDTPKLRSLPGPSAIKRLDEVLPWFYLVENKQHQKAMLLRALPLSWRKVGKVLGVNHETARDWERDAISCVVDALNRKMQLDSSAKKT